VRGTTALSRTRFAGLRTGDKSGVEHEPDAEVCGLRQGDEYQARLILYAAREQSVDAGRRIFAFVARQIQRSPRHVGQVGEPAASLRMGEAHLLRHPAHRARVVASQLKWRPAWDSLIRRINSLMARFNSLLRRNKFPVPMRREFRRKPLNCLLDCEPTAALGGPDEQNSLYFPS
jgi:hypothetical protein